MGMTTIKVDDTAQALRRTRGRARLRVALMDLASSSVTPSRSARRRARVDGPADPGLTELGHRAGATARRLARGSSGSTSCSAARCAARARPRRRSRPRTASTSRSSTASSSTTPRRPTTSRWRSSRRRASHAGTRWSKAAGRTSARDPPTCSRPGSRHGRGDRRPRSRPARRRGVPRRRHQLRARVDARHRPLPVVRARVHVDLARRRVALGRPQRREHQRARASRGNTRARPGREHG